jgi:hypothetical protein
MSQDFIELQKVLNHLVDTSMQTRQSAIHNGGVCSIFRGVEFHVEVLNNAKEILAMTNCVDKLDDIEDSKMLGDLMITNGLVLKMLQVTGDEDEIPGMGGCCGGSGPSKKPQKWPELVKIDQETPEFADGGVYMIVEEEINQKLMAFYFVAILLAVLAVLTTPIWPSWLVNKVFVGAAYLAAPIFAFLALRFVVWYILYHIGISIWILPNLFYLKNVMSPVMEFS